MTAGSSRWEMLLSKGTKGSIDAQFPVGAYGVCPRDKYHIINDQFYKKVPIRKNPHRKQPHKK
jgi:hypothetical protein